MDFTAAITAPRVDHLASELSKLCLPQEYQDNNRRLAWANSICFLFLFIGLAGLKPTPVHIRALSEVAEVVPVVIIPPEEDTPPPPTTEPQPEPEPTAEVSPDQPVVATVVAADPASASFAVPVHGPVILAPTRMAAPPPANLKRPPSSKTVALQSTEEDWGGGSNQPEYPAIALRSGYQGTVSLEIAFDATGAVLSVKLLKSAGYSSLDSAAIEKVKKSLRLRVAPGEVRVYTKEFSFRLR